ncbi:hypothetical protein GGR57DRAFT_515956 [Xylariaceae sp. FL1272]|nr:hypothetical protein GGR57DRAFT_515956 [Xylariaceae sp. FL1272]
MDPPPYDAAEGYDASDIVQPVILVLAGRFIHSESSSSTVLYELNSDVNFLSRSDHKVEFSRHEYRLRTDSYDEARTLSYARHIIDLEWPVAVISSERYAFIATPVSRRVLGGIGLKKKFQPLLTGFKVMLMKGRTEEHEVLFECTMKGRYEWWDSKGERIAIEDSADDQLKMIITAAQPRTHVDALVAAWMLRVWHDHVLEQDGGIRKKLGLYKGELTDYINRSAKSGYGMNKPA